MPSGPRAGDAERDTVRKLALSALVLTAAVGVATAGTEATFTASASGGHSITTGTPALLLGAAGGATNRLGVDVVALAPGGRAYRTFDISNVGTYGFTSYTFTTHVTTSSKLDTDVVNGLQVMLERCSDPWAESGTVPDLTYTCPGTRTTVLSSRPVATVSAALPGLASWTAGGKDHLMLTETLPSTADNTFQSLTSAITFTFDGA